MRLFLISFIFIVTFSSCSNTHKKSSKNEIEDNKMAVESFQKPMMGWASWNNFRINISEDIIKSQADAMVQLNLTDAGYHFINIDDGFYGGRNSDGKLLSHPTKFPNGMKSLANYIHSKGLKAGIYADAGKNTCGMYWDNDSYGEGVGLYGHEKQDLTTYLIDWNYDFIKVDWCGGDKLNLDEKERYTEIGSLIQQIAPETLYNICRWQFPGEWVTEIAHSWRISGDIDNNFASILNIIEKNTDLGKYASQGHYNDMDMLQVGRGMSYEEDKAHFSMWCLMQSPLILGNDLTQITDETLSIITNKELIAINQDNYVYQAKRIFKGDTIQLWAKPLKDIESGIIAVGILNQSNKNTISSLNLKNLGIDSDEQLLIKDLWSNNTYTNDDINKDIIEFDIPAHGIIVLKVKGTISENIF